MKFEVPTFTTDRLILRGLQSSDGDSYHCHFVDYEVISQLSSAVPWPYPADGVSSYLNLVVLPEQGISRWDWALLLKSNPNEVIGSIGLWRTGLPEHRGFWLGKAFWGMGLMTEAVRPVNDYAFEVLMFETLVLSNALGNVRSRRIKEKTGARLVGVRPAKFVNTSIAEAETWELTSQAWRDFKQSELLRK